jgi:hypothetical protein
MNNLRECNGIRSGRRGGRSAAERGGRNEKQKAVRMMIAMSLPTHPEIALIVTEVTSGVVGYERHYKRTGRGVDVSVLLT